MEIPLNRQSPSIALVAPTKTGLALSQLIRAGLPDASLWTKASESLSTPVPELQAYREGLSEAISILWPQVDNIIFVLTVGAVVRAIAPFLKDKATDPGIVAVNEAGTQVVSVCGGHIGGADALARQVAAILGVEPVITSASAARGLPGIDVLGEPFGWRRGSGDWTAVASAIAQAHPIEVIQTCGSSLWQRQLPEVHPFVWDSSGKEQETSARIWISEREFEPVEQPTIGWHPRSLWVGIGCERDVSIETLERGIRASLQKHNLAWEAIAGLASIALKRDETALLALAERYEWPLQFYETEILASQAVPNPSEAVNREVNTPSVAEAAALAAAETKALVVEKQILRGEDGKACTVAIALAKTEYSSRCGQLNLVGIGPGSIAQITPAARAALTQSDVVIGYQLYVDLVRTLLPSAQIVEASPITQEVQRAQRAIALANRGLTVAVISSGDCGIYGMAGLILEALARDGWDGKIPHVEVFPGVTALQAVAAKVGAPLMHDFCAISLSNLLTPWPVIKKRLEAAATADFVVALYNPRSRTRLEGIHIARQIFLQHRSPSTPVAIAKSVYRPDESIQVTTLVEWNVETADMLTTIAIGNSTSFVRGDRIITPRGYVLTEPNANSGHINRADAELNL
ncbi:MAG: precorrin-3B C(17)-methyltransferase [Cyanobacteria bacterium J06642_2]